MKICSDGNFFIEAVAIVSDGRRMDSKVADGQLVGRWLSDVLEVGGVLMLTVHSDAESGVSSLEIRADSGKFVLIAGFLDRRPMRWRNDTTEKSSQFDNKIEIGGDEWDQNSVISDVAIAERAVAEILQIGGLSQESLMNMR